MEKKARKPLTDSSTTLTLTVTTEDRTYTAAHTAEHICYPKTGLKFQEIGINDPDICSITDLINKIRKAYTNKYGAEIHDLSGSELTEITDYSKVLSIVVTDEAGGEVSYMDYAYMSSPEGLYYEEKYDRRSGEYAYDSQKRKVERETRKDPLNCRIKAWYNEVYPTDTGWDWKGKSSYTFRDLLECLLNENDVYELIPEDSVIREICFQKLASLLNVNYFIVYSMYLNQFDLKKILRDE